MTVHCFLCSHELAETSIKFRINDLTTTGLLVPQEMTDEDIMCMNCFNSRLENPETNPNKSRIYTLVEIAKKEMDKDVIDVDSTLDKLDNEMNRWSLSESVKGSVLVEVMNIIELDMADRSSVLAAINQMRGLLPQPFETGKKKI